MKHIFGTDLNVYYFNNYPSLDNFISIKLASLAKKKKWGTVSIREVNQQNRLESLEMDLRMYGSLIFKVTPSQWVLNNCLITGTGGKKKNSAQTYIINEESWPQLHTYLYPRGIWLLNRKYTFCDLEQEWASQDPWGTTQKTTFTWPWLH